MIMYGWPVPISSLTGHGERILEAACLELLDGVGRADTTEKMVSRSVKLAVHVRRAFTNAEIADLPAGWCAIPAIDPGTEEEDWEYQKLVL